MATEAATVRLFLMPASSAPVNAELVRSLATRKMKLTSLKRRRSMLLESCEELGQAIRKLDAELKRDAKAVHERLAAGAKIE
jgi:hypothetical protein